MKRRRLGSLEVSAVGLGCMSMTPIYGEPSEPEAVATLHRALEIGVDLIDTADMYGEDGSNEALIGRALKGRRGKAVLKWLEENAAAADLKPSTDTLAALDRAFPRGVTAGTRYPESQMNRVTL